MWRTAQSMRKFRDAASLSLNKRVSTTHLTIRRR